MLITFLLGKIKWKEKKSCIVSVWFIAMFALHSIGDEPEIPSYVFLWGKGGERRQAKRGGAMNNTAKDSVFKSKLSFSCQQSLSKC